MPTNMPADTSELPDTLYLEPSRARWVFSLVAALVIVSLNLYFVTQTEGTGALWFFVAIFGLVGTMAGVQLVPGSAGMWLDRKGFVYRRFWVDNRREWNEISQVTSHQMGLFGSDIAILQMVGYHRKGDPANKPREILPDTYGFPANDLSEMMNRWRNRAIS